MTVYLVAGTQAEDSKPNFIVLMKMADLKRTSQNDEDSELRETMQHIYRSVCRQLLAVCVQAAVSSVCAGSC